MSLILDGTNGLSDVDGSAATPAIRGSDANTGIFFPAADTIAFSEGGVESMRITSAGNVGIGTSSPTVGLQVDTGSDSRIRLSNSNTVVGQLQATSSAFSVAAVGGSVPLTFYTNGSERARIDSSGNLMVGTTTAPAIAGAIHVSNASGHGLQITNTTGSKNRRIYISSGGILYFWNGTNEASLSDAGTWTNASDARLKTNIREIQYGLNAVLAAQPRHYERVDVEGTYIGFVAQELQQIVPEVVSGDPEKQLGVDYGSLVAVAFKAIQELKAINDAQAQTITAQQAALESLTARVVALEGQAT